MSSQVCYDYVLPVYVFLSVSKASHEPSTLENRPIKDGHHRHKKDSNSVCFFINTEHDI